jgi:hypothetical protein
MRGVIVLIVEVSVSLILNLTASQYPEQLDPLIPYGWLLVALQVTYLLLPQKWFARKAVGRRGVFIGYLVAGTLGLGLGLVYWKGITAVIARLDAAKAASRRRALEEERPALPKPAPPTATLAATQQAQPNIDETAIRIRQLMTEGSSMQQTCQSVPNPYQTPPTARADLMNAIVDWQKRTEAVLTMDSDGYVVTLWKKAVVFSNPHPPSVADYCTTLNVKMDTLGRIIQRKSASPAQTQSRLESLIHEGESLMTFAVESNNKSEITNREMNWTGKVSDWLALYMSDSYAADFNSSGPGVGQPPQKPKTESGLKIWRRNRARVETLRRIMGEISTLHSHAAITPTSSPTEPFAQERRRYLAEKMAQLTVPEKNVLHYLVVTGASGDNAGWEAASHYGLSGTDDLRRAIRHKTNFIHLSNHGEEVNPEFRPFLEEWARSYPAMFLRRSPSEQGKATLYSIVIKAPLESLTNLKVSVEEPKPDWMDSLYSPHFPFWLKADGCNVNPGDTEFFPLFECWISGEGKTIVHLNRFKLEAPNDAWNLNIKASWASGSSRATVRLTRSGQDLNAQMITEG